MKYSSIYNFLAYTSFGLSIYYIYKEEFSNVPINIILAILTIMPYGIIVLSYDLLNKKTDNMVTFFNIITLFGFLYYTYDYWIVKKLKII